jgi:hypothetical protein
MVICPPVGPCSFISPPSPLVSLPPALPVDIPALEKIALNLIPPFLDSASSRFVNQNHLFRTIAAIPSLTLSSPTLQQFFNNNISNPSSKELFRQSEQDIASANFSAANSKLALISPQNTAESFHKQFYQIYLNYLQNGSVSPSDSALLVSISTSCPFKDGAVVYQARTFYNAINNSITIFEDNCNTTDARLLINQNANNNTTSNLMQIYPNPNDGYFNIHLNQDISIADIDITDVTGKVIYSNTITFTQNTSVLKLNLQPGVYMIHLKNKESNISFIKKLIIQ